MATDQLSKNDASPRGGMKLVEYEEYIDAQVEATRRLVKIVDLATSLVVLASGVLAFLLAAAVAEHWLVPGGFPVAMRAVMFVLLAGGVIYYAYRHLWPLTIRAINPVYAAQAIEQSGPALKNSLINLLLFRHRRAEISDAVYRTLEEQAAQRLSHIPVDSAVDRTLLIRVGYVLLAIVAAASLYKVLSPKDPLIAAQRILLPWAEIVPASRVSISDVEPGSVTVSRGEFVEVTASVRGLGENDAVLLRFTTDDGQAINKPVTMKLSKDGSRFEARLPEGEAATGAVGLAQDVRYRIEAGDARTLDYSVNVVSTPSILVERVDYDFPSYTGYPDQQVVGIGDIRAIEGTRVTVHGRANSGIREAHVDLSADGRRDVRMTSDGTDARATFTLRLREDRQTPMHASYVLRFTNEDGRTNSHPAKYTIRVEPDVGPEASIHSPEKQEVQVRLDEVIEIGVAARDPDFALSEVRLRGEVAGRQVLDEPLLEGDHRGKLARRYRFIANEHGLQAGDAMQYWVTASDNRAPQPNTATSERKTLRILSPEPAQSPPPDRLAQRDPQRGDPQNGQQEQQPGEGAQDGEQQPNGGQAGDTQQGQPGEQTPGAAGGAGQQPENQQPASRQTDEQPPRGGEQSGSPDAEPRQENQGQGAGGEHAPGEAQASPGDEQSQDGSSQDGGARPGERANGEPRGGKATGGRKAGEAARAEDGEPNADGRERMDGSPQQNGGQPEPGSQPQNGGNPRDDSAAEPTPVSSEGDNDAEAFERIRRHLRRDGELSDDASGSANEGPPDEIANAQRTPEQETGREGDGSKQAPEAGEQQSGSDAADEQSGMGERADEKADGRGAEMGDDRSETSSEQLGSEDEPGQSPVGQEPSTKGPSGAGDEQEPQGAPDWQPDAKPGEKRQQSPSAGEPSDRTEPPAGGRGKKESDSQGEQGGDRTGGGEEGGGQNAPRDGTGSAGQNESADEGAGESSQQGAGEDSPSAAGDASGDARTGEPSGETRGRGSKQRPGEGLDAGGEDRGETSFDRDAERADEAGEEQEAGRGDKEAGRQGARGGGESGPRRSPQDSRGEPDNGGPATGGTSEPGAAAASAPRSEGTVPEGDEANLEYARKQTDLVLEKLSDQLNRKEVDDELLDELGWSEEDLRRFVERWQARKKAAQRGDRAGGTARGELDEALRSLGLRRGRLQQGPLKEDSLRDLREGYRGSVPLEYQDRLRAYSEGVSRAREDGE